MNRSTRRKFLNDLGAASLLLPTLPSLPLLARAQAGSQTTAPLRLVIFSSTNGVHDQAFWPSAQTTQIASGIYGTPLSQIAGPVSPIFGSEFDSLRGKFSLIRGMGQIVSPYGADNIVHDAPSVMCLSHIHENNDSYGLDGPKVGSSLDCIVENSIGFKGKTAISALRIEGGPSKWPFSYWRPNGGAAPPYDQVMRPEYVNDDPRKFFEKVFPVASGTPPTSPVASTYRRKVFDSLLLQFDAIAKSRGISASDKERLQTHTEFLNELKSKVQSGAGAEPSTASCQAPTLASGTSVLDRYRNNLDTIAAALHCDRTRVVCYMLNNYDDDGKITWDADHANSHEEGANLQAKGLGTNYVANCAQFKGWQAKRIAQFMNRLASLKDADGSSVLDNTLIIWTNQHGGGHCITNYPTMIGGGAAGKFRMGLYLDYRLRTAPLTDRSVGRPLTNLWMAVMRGLGVPAADYLRQGEDGAFGEGLKSNDDFARKYGSYNVGAALRRELIPYFYTGPA